MLGQTGRVFRGDAMSVVSGGTSIFRRSRLFIVYSSYLLLVLSQNVVSKDASRLKVESVMRLPAIDKQFSGCAQQPWWLGGDADTSVYIPSLKSHLWLFGDTLVGNCAVDERGRTYRNFSMCGDQPCEGSMPHSTVALQQDSTNTGRNFKPQFYAKRDAHGTPQSLWSPCGSQGPSCCHNDNTFFWVVQGAVVADNKLALTAVRVNATPGEGLGFAVVGTALLVVEMIGDNPTEWPYSCSDVPLPGYLWTMALTPDPNTIDGVLLLGQSGGAANPGALACRLSSRDLAAHSWANVECWTDIPGAGLAWRVLQTPRAALVPLSKLPGTPEASLVYNRYLMSWYIAIIPPFTTRVELWSAETLTGPWGMTHAFNISAPWNDTTRFFCYAAKAHPQLSSAKESLVFSYVCNTWNVSLLGEPAGFGAYVPRFVEVQVSVEATTVAAVWPHWLGLLGAALTSMFLLYLLIQLR